MAKRKMHIYNTTLAELSAALDAGNIDIAVGDKVVTPHELLGEIKWVVIGTGVDIPDAERKTVTLHMDSVPDVMHMPFDTPCKQYKWGHNLWQKSSIRKYLNGEFLSGFPTADQDAMRLTDKTTFRNDNEGGEAYTTQDKLFLLSASEAGYSSESIKDEGAAYPLYADVKKRRKVDTPSGDKSIWWLRSPYPWYANYVRIVNPDGTLSNSNASSGSGAAAACVI